MKIIPAIDILGGKVVRLFKGSFKEKKEYSDDPVSMAQFWQKEGAGYVHIVDLDGAKQGEPKNLEVIKKVIESISIPVEVGGGIRTVEQIEKYFNLRVDKVVLGTAVMNDLSFLDQKEISNSVDKIAISFDAIKEKDGILPTMKVGTGGWSSEVTILDYRGLIDRLVSSKIKFLNYTNRSKDGTLEGLSEADVSSLNDFLNAIRSDVMRVIYAGGIASLDDIKKLSQLKNKKLDAVIIGKALYEKKFSLKQAQEVADDS